MPNINDRKAFPISYSMNGELCKRVGGAKPTFECLAIERIVRMPSKVMLFLHEKRESINDGLFLWKNNGDSPGNVHYDGTTLSFCDGHVKWMETKKIQIIIDSDPSPWDPQPWR